MHDKSVKYYLTFPSIKEHMFYRIPSTIPVMSYISWILECMYSKYIFFLSISSHPHKIIMFLFPKSDKLKCLAQCVTKRCVLVMNYLSRSIETVIKKVGFYKTFGILKSLFYLKSNKFKFPTQQSWLMNMNPKPFATSGLINNLFFILFI